MRYPQLFATLAIEKKLNLGIRKGIVWHTQGSGKTALAFYNVNYLKDYSNKNGFFVRLHNQKELPVSRRRSTEFMDRAKLFFQQ